LEKNRKQRILYILRLFVVTVIFALLFVPFLAGFATTWLFTHTPCNPGAPPDVMDMENFEAVSFHSPILNGELQGYFVHGTNGVTIIIPPALGSGAGSWMQEHAVLNEQGYNLFSYDARNCLGYANSLGYLEAIEVRDALDYLATRADVDMDRIGIQGFSAGGAASIMATARYPEIRAVIAMGGYHDFSDAVNAYSSAEWFAPIYTLGANIGYRLATGLPLTVLSPLSVIGDIAPRPVLLIYGSTEVSLSGAYRQLEAANDHADLLVIENGTHGTYWIHAPELYTERVIRFLDSAFGIAR
jgi:pimeloyl-ACP methyl ester carboxylesterase